MTPVGSYKGEALYCAYGTSGILALWAILSQNRRFSWHFPRKCRGTSGTLCGVMSLESARSEDRHALVMLDVMLPGLNGFEICEKLRETNSRTPVLLLTARGAEEDVLRGFRCGPRLTLIVGGPLGVHSSVLRRAEHKWSLSPLTFPHELVRGIVAEQLYRAMTIRRGMPYHK